MVSCADEIYIFLVWVHNVFHSLDQSNLQFSSGNHERYHRKIKEIDRHGVVAVVH